MEITDLVVLQHYLVKCHGCKLRDENERYKIKFCKMKLKNDAKIMFIGRDPNYLSVDLVGDISNNKPAFHRTILEIINLSGIEEKDIYITNILKCHWYSKGNKIKEINYRKKSPLYDSYANICSDLWLFREINILKPSLIISFGEDNFITLRNYITLPNKPFYKSFREIEEWQILNGTMKIRIFDSEYLIFILRHPGNVNQLNKDSEEYQSYKIIERTLIDRLKNL